MQLEETTLPWNNLPVRTTGDISAYLAERLPGSLGEQLPRSTTIFIDREVGDENVRAFLDGMLGELADDLRRRERRAARFVELGLFDEPRVRRFLTARRHVQPWILYYSESGGLRIPVRAPGETDARYGVVPCSTMQNHGVAWRQSEGECQLWLVTARKEEQGWDWDSDIGHESAHAAFAHIPLFVQPPPAEFKSADLTRVSDASELGPRHLSRMSYIYMEMAVIAVRGEKRETDSGFPVTEQREELFALLRLSHELMPGFGFDRALRAYRRVDGLVNANTSDEIYEIGAAVMRVLPHLSLMINRFEPPTADWYRSLAPEEDTSYSGR